MTPRQSAEYQTVCTLRQAQGKRFLLSVRAEPVEAYERIIITRQAAENLTQRN